MWTMTVLFEWAPHSETLHYNAYYLIIPFYLPDFNQNLCMGTDYPRLAFHCYSKSHPWAPTAKCTNMPKIPFYSRKHNMRHFNYVLHSIFSVFLLSSSFSLYFPLFVWFFSVRIQYEAYSLRFTQCFQCPFFLFLSFFLFVILGAKYWGAATLSVSETQCILPLCYSTMLRYSYPSVLPTYTQ